MKQPTDWMEKRASQRKVAEAMVCSLSPLRQEARATEALAHELLVHKIELEMQLLELQEANSLLDEARHRYSQLYEFAPAGYMSVDPQGAIQEANLAAVLILGVTRDTLSGQSFKSFMARDEQERWCAFFDGALKPAQNQRTSLVVALERKGGAPFLVHIRCKPDLGNDQTPLLLIALTGLDEIKQAETEREYAIASS
ncbi:PAS domain S-box-containing protein [Silvimonas terrae]|uniref:PAS domain S-box-containing protein n=1 Tax=Silvimonas terrae TaxID=300266 RepID=A0A840RHF3_9NEIS|nr:PAS domain-containing protein [Silvimonas terrae]MBB5191756.1 PAS domain S-box-containing protein [Silvimonas terrae]